MPDLRWDAREMSAWCARLCLGCSVRIDCVSEALDRHHDTDVGIWGATTALQRDKIRRRRISLEKAWQDTAQIVEDADRILWDVEEFVSGMEVDDGSSGT
jgi:hypothetical protein